MAGVSAAAAGFIFCFWTRGRRRRSAKHFSSRGNPSPPNMAEVGDVPRPDVVPYERGSNGIMQVLEIGQVQANGGDSWSSPLSGYPGSYAPFTSPPQPTAVLSPIPTRLFASLPPPSIFLSATPSPRSNFSATYPIPEEAIHGGSSALYTSSVSQYAGTRDTTSPTNIGNIFPNATPSIQTNSTGGTSQQQIPPSLETPLQDSEHRSSTDESSLGPLPPPRARRFRALPNLWPNSRRSGAGAALTREPSSTAWSLYSPRSPPPRMELVSPAPPSYRTGMDTPDPQGHRLQALGQYGLTSS